MCRDYRRVSSREDDDIVRSIWKHIEVSGNTSLLRNESNKNDDGVVHEQVFTKNVLFMNVLKNVAHDTGAVSVAGASATGGGGKMITVHYGRNTGSAAGSESLTLPTAGQQAYIQANIPMKYNFHQISLTDVVLQGSKRSKEFLVNVLESEYDGAKNDMQRQLSRQGYGIKRLLTRLLIPSCAL